ncbi:hypothetical protein HWV62_1394 [Athelia sp. TMB]|nr:hypothetical protein HWV62_1394 [Athelia sp. TMB]
MSSLSPESYTASSPTTPLTPGFRRASPGPSHSTVDLPGEFGAIALTAPSISGQRSASGSSGEGSSSVSARAMKGFFGKIASKSRRTPRAIAGKSPLVNGDAQSEPVEDDGISMPWNFQHNIHVDEGYTGLPPSWSTSLQAAGFSEDEIAAIQARRSNGSSTPYIYSGRPDSPASVNPNVLANPPPRTTSTRQMSDAASIASSRYRPPTTATTNTISSTSSRPGVPPPLQPITSRPIRKPSARSIYSDASFDSGNPDAQYVYVNSHFELTSHAPSDSSHVSSTSSQSPAITTPNTSTSPPIILTPIANNDNTIPRTPPRRTFRVVNHSPGTSSPPPAYKSPASNSAFAQVAARAEKANAESNIQQQPQQQSQVEMDDEGQDDEVQDEEDVSQEASASTATHDFAKKLMTLPPRLSLHETSGDLDSWSAALFSAIPSSSGSLLTPTSASLSSKGVASAHTIPNPSSSSSSSVSAAANMAPTSSSSSRSPPSSAPLPTSGPSSNTRQPSTRRAPQRPIPSAPLTNVEEETQAQILQVPEPASTMNGTGETANGHHGPSTPLYNEIMELVQQTSPRVSPIPLVANKPATPVLLTNEDDSANGTVPGEHSRESNGNLAAAHGRRDSNRDSNMSNVSSVTVTDTAIVRGATFATRAVANVVSPTPKKQDADLQQVTVFPDPDAELNGEDDEEDEYEEEEELIFPPTPSPIQPGFPTDESTPKNPSRHYKTASMLSGARMATPSLTPPPAPSSPHSSYFSESPTSSSESDSQSRSSSSRSNSLGLPAGLAEKPPTLPPKDPSVYLRMSPAASPLPSPARSTFSESSLRETFGAPKVERTSTIPKDPDATLKTKPSIKLNGVHIDESPRPSQTPIIPTSVAPAKRYRGWLSDVVMPLEDFIDEATDPRDHYTELQEIAEAESGSVYAARVVKPEALGLPSDVAFVAIKNVPILPSGSPKLLDLKKELTVIRGVIHENVLTMDALYVDLVDNALWIRMELMERSLADVVGLVAEGLMVQERMIARFASDVSLSRKGGRTALIATHQVLNALDYLQKQHIAHRDVRSDNLLLNKNGVLKLADFSNAVQVTPEKPECSGAAGVIYWQAPEMRTGGTYHALKVDVWSLGATVWETAQSEPPFTDIQDPRQFGDRWPSLSHPEIYSRSFHEFLRLCSEPAATRPDPSDLLNTSFIRNACGRPVNVQLLSQCRAIEETMLEQENAES